MTRLPVDASNVPFPVPLAVKDCAPGVVDAIVNVSVPTINICPIA